MYIENVTLKSVPADSLVLPVEEGTILTKNGTIPADLSQAYGIVPEKITNIPPTKMIYLAVAGTIDLKLNNVSFTEEEMQALGKDFNFVPGDEGGGNPNRVQTITGTLANPFTDWTKAEYDEFIGAYSDGNASASMTVDATEIGYVEASLVLAPFYNEPFFLDAYIEADGDVTAISVSYLGNFEETPLLSEAKGYTTAGGVVDLAEYASILPTTLTIIWHPLPDQS